MSDAKTELKLIQIKDRSQTEKAIEELFPPVERPVTNCTQSILVQNASWYHRASVAFSVILDDGRSFVVAIADNLSPGSPPLTLDISGYGWRVASFWVVWKEWKDNPVSYSTVIYSAPPTSIGYFDTIGFHWKLDDGLADGTPIFSFRTPRK